MKLKCFYLSWAFVCFVCASAHAENWVKYYETRTCPEAKRLCTRGATIWDTRCTCTGSESESIWIEQRYLDTDSIRPEGNLLRYRTKIVDAQPEHTEIFEMIVDCAAKKRGQLPSHELYDTFEGTMGGAELKIACELEKRARQQSRREVTTPAS